MFCICCGWSNDRDGRISGSHRFYKSLSKDIEKIQELQRRLRTTIPRIPILRGDASTQIGSQVGVQKRGMSGLDFSRFFTSTKTATKTAFPFLDVLITAIVFALSRGKSKNNWLRKTF